LDEEPLAFLADAGIPDGQAIQTTISQNVVFQTDDLDVLSEMSGQMSNQVTHWDKVNQETKTVNESLTAELERYKERVKNFEQRLNIDLSCHEKLIDSQIDDMV
ncbi:hypothetical protein Tco_0187989, partial [Tanacetum coccineum]